MLVVDKVTYKPAHRSYLSDVSFMVEPGEIVGLVGVEGAGKSTLLRICAGLLEPSIGTARIVGVDVAQERARTQALVGYQPQGAPLPKYITPREYLASLARIRGLTGQNVALRVGGSAKDADISTVLDVPIDRLGRVDHLRTALAGVVLNDPTVLLLDEPSAGLDPVQKLTLRGIVKKYSSRRSILVSLNSVEDASILCTHVVMLHGGRVVHQKTSIADFAKLASSGHLEDAFLLMATGRDPSLPDLEPQFEPDEELL
jgi:ABC-2 type transport system ATP-binding protein